MKYFLLIAGDQYYPEHGDNDWIGTYATYNDAYAEITIQKIQDPGYFSKGSRTGQIKTSATIERYLINNRAYDWFEIIDLREWIFKE